MITERFISIRAAVNNDTRKPAMHILLTPWLCFAFVQGKDGKPKTVPGFGLAAAQSNGLAYLRGKHGWN